MSRRLRLALIVYAPHLLEEHFTNMWNDPLIVFAYSPLVQLSPRQASYLIFQVMMAASLLLGWLFSLGGRARAWVMMGLAVALLAESHHLIRALLSHHYNSGLWTALPMPLAGAHILRTIHKGDTEK